LTPAGRRVAGSLLVVACLGAAGACSSGGGSAAATTIPSVPGSTPAPAPTVDASTDPDALPRVDLIAPAVQALEAKLGGPQQYFEVNATAKLVNLIIAVNNATLAQTWLYLDGELTSKDAQPASGHTFVAAALTFDAGTVLGQVRHDLADSVLDFFYVLGGADGSVQYKVDVTSPQGGQLEVVVGPDGKVLEVDPLTSAGTPSSVPPTAG
jgi:hypothetical protein